MNQPDPTAVKAKLDRLISEFVTAAGSNCVHRVGLVLVLLS
jgi:hypothetical protein